MSSNGIDVSDWQKGTDLSKVAGLDFVIAKATEGITVDDPQYEQWQTQLTGKTMHFGAYHLLNGVNVRAQADFFTSVARPESGRSLWVDYELYGYSGEMDAELIGYFICEVKRNVGNQQKVGIYCNGTGLARIKPYLSEIPYNGIWFADRSPMTTQNPSLAWQVHQYEVFDEIDRDYSVWSPAQWKSYWAW